MFVTWGELEATHLQADWEGG